MTILINVQLYSQSLHCFLSLTVWPQLSVAVRAPSVDRFLSSKPKVATAVSQSVSLTQTRKTNYKAVREQSRCRIRRNGKADRWEASLGVDNLEAESGGVVGEPKLSSTTWELNYGPGRQ